MSKNVVNQREKNIFRITILGSFINFLLLIFKFVAGVFGNSAAMLADAVHSLSDFVTDIIVLIFVKISNKPEDSDHDYGHGKFETLATAIIGLALLAVGIGIMVDASTKISNFLNGEDIGVPSMLALWAALISIILKEIIFQLTIHVGRKENSQAVITNAWHHRSDALSSIGTALGIGGTIILGENWRILDPLAAVVVSLFIVRISFNLLMPCIDELLEKSLPAEIEEQIIKIAMEEPGASHPHHLRTRRIGNNYAIELHIRMDGNLSLKEAHEKTSHIERRLKEVFGKATHVGIHTEPIK